MNKIKLKWYVQPAPTGRYRSFERRAFPSADYIGFPRALAAASLHCKDDYVPADVKVGNHAEITIRVAMWNKETNGFNWVKIEQKAKTVKEAKQVAEDFINSNPECQPIERHWNY